MSTCPVSRGLSHRTGVSVAVAPSPHGSDDADLGGAPGSSKPGGRAAVVSEHIKHIIGEGRFQEKPRQKDDTRIYLLEFPLISDFKRGRC